MKKEILKNTCKLDELPTIGEFIAASYKIHILDFTSYSPEYTLLYWTNLEIERKSIEDLINPKQMRGEQKIITQRIYSNQILVTISLNQIEGYAKRAKGLTIEYTDFGFGSAKSANNSGDIEGLVSSMRDIAKNAAIDANMTAMTVKGYSTEKQADFIALTNAIDNDNVAQNKKINQLATLVADNHAAINKYWDKLVDICDAGKRIFGNISVEKNKEYVMSTVISRVRNNAAKSAVIGDVTIGAKIEFKPLTGGRRRVAKVGTKGEYAVKGIAPGEYQGIMTVKGKPPVIKNIVVEVGGHVVENF